MLNGREIIASISKSLGKGKSQLLTDHAVTKSSEKAICSKKEEMEEPDDAYKQQRKKLGSPEAAWAIRQLLVFTRPLPAFYVMSQYHWNFLAGMELSWVHPSEGWHRLVSPCPVGTVWQRAEPGGSQQQVAAWDAASSSRMSPQRSCGCQPLPP